MCRSDPVLEATQALQVCSKVVPLHRQVKHHSRGFHIGSKCMVQGLCNVGHILVPAPRPILLYIACPLNTTDSSMIHWFIPPLHTSNRQVRIKLWHLSLSDSHMRVLVEPQLRLLHDTLAHRRPPALNSPIPITWNVQPTHNI